MWTGAELKKRIAELDAYWEGINAAALGRAVKPIVSDQLAKRVADLYADYRAFREQLGGLQFSLTVEAQIRDWRVAADHYAGLVRGEGGKAPDLAKWDPTVIEQAEHAAEVVLDEGKKFLGGAIVLAGLVWLISRGRR
jgi:hypothetical protein